MSRLTVRLPETLHHQLSEAAREEGISLNQYIVYALTRQVTMASVTRPATAAEIAEPRAAYTTLGQGVGLATPEEIAAKSAEKTSTRLVSASIRSHSAFLNSYAPEDEGLYDDYPAR